MEWRQFVYIIFGVANVQSRVRGYESWCKVYPRLGVSHLEVSLEERV